MNNPDRYNVCLILVGLLAGVLGGPVVLGRCAPGIYQRVFLGDHQAQKELDVHDQRYSRQRLKLAGSGVTDAALIEFDQRHQPQRQLIELQLRLAQTAHTNRLFGRLAALMLALVLIMVASRFVQRTELRCRLTTAIHALAGVWLALALAGPTWRHVPAALTFMLVAVALTSAWIGLNRIPNQ